MIPARLTLSTATLAKQVRTMALDAKIAAKRQKFYSNPAVGKNFIKLIFY
jgi:hypothetical protein